MHRLAFLVLTMILATSTARADAVTYTGTLGSHDIVAEITEAADGPIIGRYSYLEKGGDIPLHAQPAPSGVMILSEEQPCTEKTCNSAEGSEATDFPIGAIWTLDGIAGAQNLTGSWRLLGKSKSLPVTLARVGSRPLSAGGEVSVMALRDFSIELSYSDDRELTAATAPYEFFKLQGPLEFGENQSLNGSAYQLVVDPRTKFAFPRIVSLADGSDPAAANTYLEARRQQISLAALDCLGTVYLGFGWQYPSDMALGGYEDETFTVTYLSPKVLSWTEGGSLFCGGAHPNNHYDAYNLDIAAGEELNLERVLSGWVPIRWGEDTPADIDPAIARAEPDNYGFGPDDALIAYVRKHRDIIEGEDPECGIDDLIATNLGVRFSGENHIVFYLDQLPHAIFACGYDLVDVPLADVEELLAPDARELFPHLN